MFLHEGNPCRFTFLLIHKYKLESFFNAVSLGRVCFPICGLLFSENSDFALIPPPTTSERGELLPKTAFD